MRIVACLNWYKEHPEWLAELATSLQPAGVTHLVAIDGPYNLYPDKQPASTPQEYAALADACLTSHISLITYTPCAPWAGNETEKRTALFNLAHAIAQPHRDWLLIIDGDEHLTHVDDLAGQLAITTHDTATLEHTEPGRRTAHERRLYRAQPTGIHVKDAHYRYITGDGTTLWDGSRPGTHVPALQLQGVQLTHRPTERTPERKQARDRYYEERLLTHAETTP